LRKDERDNIGLQRKAAIKADPTDHSFDEKYKKAKARVIMKELQIQEHKLKADLIREPWNEDYKKLLQDTQAKLKENDGKVKKSKTPSSSITTDTSIGDTSKKTTGIEIKVQAPSRAGTSLSPFAKSATRSMRK
jgi:ABC-type proline/glycine betaine transport system ATPase subunit